MPPDGQFGSSFEIASAALPKRTGNMGTRYAFFVVVSREGTMVKLRAKARARTWTSEVALTIGIHWHEVPTLSDQVMVRVQVRQHTKSPTTPPSPALAERDRTCVLCNIQAVV